MENTPHAILGGVVEEVRILKTLYCQWSDAGFPRCHPGCVGDYRETGSRIP